MHNQGNGLSLTALPERRSRVLLPTRHIPSTRDDTVGSGRRANNQRGLPGSYYQSAPPAYSVQSRADGASKSNYMRQQNKLLPPPLTAVSTY